jgi:hypothetical protein
MYEHRQRRAVAKKWKSVVNPDFKKGGNKRPMNIYREKPSGRFLGLFVMSH